MRLTKNNIKHIAYLEKDGVPYSWTVFTKANAISDARQYVNYSEEGRTTMEPYPVEWLPKSVQAFLKENPHRLDSVMEYKGSEIGHYFCYPGAVRHIAGALAQFYLDYDPYSMMDYWGEEENLVEGIIECLEESPETIVSDLTGMIEELSESERDTEMLVKAEHLMKVVKGMKK